MKNGGKNKSVAFIFLFSVYIIFVIHTVMLLSLNKILSPPVHLRSWYCDNKVI